MEEIALGDMEGTDFAGLSQDQFVQARLWPAYCLKLMFRNRAWGVHHAATRYFPGSSIPYRTQTYRRGDASHPFCRSVSWPAATS